MNERIKQLWGQAMDQAVPETYTKLSYSQVLKIKQVFAELIVYDMLGELTNDDSLGPTRIEAIGRLALRYGVAR